MSFPRRTRRAFLVPAAIVLAFSLTPALAACGGNPLQGAIEQATGGQLDIGGTTLPADFPTEVPLTSGEIVSTASFGNVAEGKVWNVTIKVSGLTSIEDISSQLQGAGFEVAGGTASSEEGAANIFTKDPYSVLVVVAKDDKGGFIANYSVTSAKPGS